MVDYDFDAKLSNVYKTINQHGTMLGRLDEKITSTEAKTDKISATLDHLVRIDERFIQFVEADRDSKSRMWNHIEKSENRLNTMQQSEVRTATVAKVVITMLTASIGAYIAYLLGK